MSVIQNKAKGDRNKITVKAQKLEELVLETYHRSPGLKPPQRVEIREEYTLCLNIGYGGTYLYRGSSFSFPQNSLTIIHSDEPHRPARLDLKKSATYRMIYIPPDWLNQIVEEVDCSSKSLPYFPDVTIRDRQLTTELLKLHIGSNESISTLERESRFLTAIALLISRHSQPNRNSEKIIDRPAIERLKSYLQVHYSDNISLSDLSRVANLSSYHLCRTFKEVVGLPPHRYQTQLRINSAKKLLLAGKSISYTATEVGFFDQSHFHRHFKRTVGVAPKKYQILQ